MPRPLGAAELRRRIGIDEASRRLLLSDFTLRGKRRPLPRRQLRAVLATVGAFVAVPYAEELWRCQRHRGENQEPADAAGSPA